MIACGVNSRTAMPRPATDEAGLIRSRSTGVQHEFNST